MAEVALHNVKKRFDEVDAVRGVSLQIPDKEFVVLVGPSGCGKSTTLRMIAGLEEVTSGDIVIGGDVVNDVPPKDRDIAMVFQNYALYPHMTVFENMSFGLKLRRIPKPEIKARVEKAAKILDITDLLGRRPKQLSGGQRQRVAMGRAIVRNPKVFLFDEPLSNLDAKLRIEMRNELRRIQRETGLTAIYVTHDQAEALAISDLIIVMRDGRIVEQGRPVDIYRRPRHVFTAQFLGATNLIAGTVAEMDAGLLAVTTALGRILGIDPTGALRPGAKVMVSIRPEDLSAHVNAGSVNTIQGEMTFAAFAGAAVEAELRCGDTNIACLLDRDADLTLGRTVTLRAKPNACLVLPEE